MLALKNNIDGINITIWDINRSILKEAQRIADKVADSCSDAVKNSDLIWIATPVNAIIELIPKIVRMNPYALIADTGSTKMHIIRSVNALQKTFRYVGTHPLTGTEKTGPSSWNPDLFKHATFFIVQTKKTNKEDMRFINNIILKLNAIPYEISAMQHDRMLAYTSHLPYLIAVSLKKMMINSGLKHSPAFKGPAFVSMTRIAQCPATVMQPILATNPENIIKALTAFIKQLSGEGQILDEYRRI